MNYRHQYHAGNFADVMKHVLLVQLLRALQRKEKGFLYLDTHAGRGRYDLAAAAAGDTRERQPEWPAGIGRLWQCDGSGAPPAVAEYLELVRRFDREAGNLGPEPRFYPGSPWIARRLGRPVDRCELGEMHAAECAALRAEFAGVPGVTVREGDGYGLVRALLPPAERRALVLIDPPFEAQAEYARATDALAEGVRRLAGGVLAVWYPLTDRAGRAELAAAVRARIAAPVLACELDVAGPQSETKLRGCGLLVVNPPWQFAGAAEAALQYLSRALAREPGGGVRLDWIVPERG
jgi:23S rRNA (adenine2030-N6)-methyltransferase